MARTKNGRSAGAQAVPAPTRRHFSVDEYYRMAEAGILHEDDRVELIDGEIFKMAPIGSRHAASVRNLTEWLIMRLGARAIVSTQSPVSLSTEFEPEPDVAVLRPQPERYASAHPGPTDVILLVEVADTSLAYDREFKLPRYAESAIPEVWIVDLAGKRVLVYRRPSDSTYSEAAVAKPGDSIVPLAFPDLVLPVNDLLV
jgi:Uma2 family endonuclease